MPKPKRIGMSLFDEELKALINASAKIFPMSQDDIDNNINPNNYEYAKVGRSIYVWHNDAWEYVIADDVDIAWADIRNKPAAFTPVPHVHAQSDITGLDVYTKTEVDTKLEGKAEVEHTHNYAPADHDHDTQYAVKSTETQVSDHELRLYNIEQGYTEGHTHPNVDLLNTLTQADIDKWNTVTGKADKTYVDTELAKKVASTTFQGHADSTVIHVTQTEKDYWNAAATRTGITVSDTKPTDGSMWYKVVG